MNSWRRRPIMQTQASRYVFPALGALYERCQRFAYPILRVVFGLWFIPHGCQKLFGWWGGNIAGTAKGVAAAGIEPGMFWADYIRTLELVGGVLVAIGLLTRPVAGPFFRFMFLAAISGHRKAGHFLAKRRV